METFIANVPSPVGSWAVEGTENAVTAVYLPTQPRRASKGSPPRAVARAVKQLEEYFSGKRREFDVPLADVVATEFQRNVWGALVDIPFGEVRTYGEVAESVDRPERRERWATPITPTPGPSSYRATGWSPPPDSAVMAGATP